MNFKKYFFMCLILNLSFSIINEMITDDRYKWYVGLESGYA